MAQRYCTGLEHQALWASRFDSGRERHYKILSNIYIIIKQNINMDKENLELAEEHIKIAEELVVKEAQEGDEKEQEQLKDAEFALEKAETKINSIEE